MNANQPKSLHGRLVQQARPYWLHLTGIFLLSLLSSPFALVAPLPLKIAVDNVLDHRPLPQFLNAWLPQDLAQSPTGLLVLAIGLLVGVAVLTQLRDFANALLTAYTGEKLLRNFRAQLFRHVQRLSFSYHDRKGTADSTYRIQYDAAAVQNIVVEGVVPFITSAITFLTMIYVTARINWRLAIVALTVAPAIFLVSRTYRRRMRRQSREVKKMESSALAVVHEVLGAARVVKAFGQESREEQRFVHKSNEGMRARLLLVYSEGGYGLLVALITAAGTAAVMFIGLRAIQAGALTLGSFMLVWGYIAQLYGPLKTISKKAGSLQNHLAGAERAFALLDELPDVVERANARSLARARGAMIFRNVSFAYDHDRPVLRGISFEIEPGVSLGIAGTTGAGKTTLVNLLTRFYDPTAGQILLDGVDLRDYKLADLRNQFAIVLQEPVLFSSSIAENIAYARPGAGEAEIAAAAKAANAQDFITRLPQGYDTLVGERGLRLSGGERQRISLARAFLKDAPVLILDEPTSSVDVKTEAAIVEAMERLTRGRTTFIITHRESALKHCHRVLRIEHGCVMSLEEVAAPVAEKTGPPEQETGSPQRNIHV
jgi:ATP-binding cassette, subfamily B, bacterial